jgi:hypothetical protein
MAVPESLKRNLATQIRQYLTGIIQNARHAETAIAIMLEKDMQAGGDNEITDAELSILGITYDDLVKGKTLIDNLVLFIENGTPAQADYEATFNLLRTDYGV